jgi:hypothetical protein
MDAVATTTRIDNLPGLIARARKLFDQGDVAAARLLAGGAYDQAKAGVQFARRAKASQQLRDKARRLLGDALLIETLCKIDIAVKWDAAQREGRASTGVRPSKPDSMAETTGKTVPDENGFADGFDAFTAEQAGLSRKDIHEGRKLAEAERKNPGLVERAIAARIEEGFEPSRRSLRTAIGTNTATKEERGFNLYETPPEAVHTLLALERFAPTIWEPACGRGAISRICENAGYDVVLSDLIDYGTADRLGTVQEVRDFLTTSEAPDCRADSCPDIITNPPYGEALNAFVAHALRVHRPKKMALLLNLNFLCGSESADRRFARDEQRPSRIHVFTRRLPMMHRDGWDGPEASSSMNTAWFVWERDEAGNYGRQRVVECVDWKDFQPKGKEQ